MKHSGVKNNIELLVTKSKQNNTFYTIDYILTRFDFFNFQFCFNEWVLEKVNSTSLKLQ